MKINSESMESVTMKKLKLGIMGSGFLGGIIADAWKDGYLPDYELVGIYGRNKEKSEEMAERVGCKACDTIEELLKLKPDYIAEAASVQSVKEMAEKISAAGANLIVLSIGAFADAMFYEKIKDVNRVNGTRIYLASGAIGGFDVLRTVSLMGMVKSGIETTKGPKSLINTPLFDEKLLEGQESTRVFQGNAKEAIELLPTKVNVAVAASLATAGPEETSVKINSIPGFVGDDHKITAEIEGIRAVIDIYSETSAIAGWSVVEVLRNIVSPIVF